MLQVNQTTKVRGQLLKLIFTQVQFHQMGQTAEVWLEPKYKWKRGQQALQLKAETTET